jgi:hypothetical protein
MFFWGPSHGPGVEKKSAFSFIDLEPDGCLVADQLKADKQKGLHPRWVVTLQKKLYSFCDGQMFFIDRGLLMGAMICNLVKLQI